MTTSLATYEEQATELTLPPAAYIAQELAAVKAFQLLVRQNLIEGSDYGVIPGTGNKPALFKPGAEKMAKLLGLADHYEIAEKVEDWDRPLFRYVIKCQLRSVRTGSIVSESFGECNSMESKYRYRWLFGSQVADNMKHGVITRTINTKNGPATQYRFDNDDIYSHVNTILKMAQKRALVGAALSAGRLSELFTQDLEDLAPTSEQAIDVRPTRIGPEGATITTIVKCPTHPNRNPKEWGGRGDNPAIWKCTAKAPTESGYCEWTAARDLPAAPSVTVDPPAPHIPPVQELTDFVKAHGWDRANLMDYIDQENLRSVTGGFNAAQVLAALKVHFADQESEAPEDDSYELPF